MKDLVEPNGRPNGMAVVRLGDVCSFRGKVKLAKCVNVSFAPMEDVPLRARHYTPSHVRQSSELSGGYTFFQEGDVLLAKVTPCFENGKIAFVEKLENGIGFGSSELLAFVCSNEIRPEYLFYFLQAPSFVADGSRRMKGTGGLKRLPKDFILNYSICLPALDRQHEIAVVLDRICELKRNAEAQLAQLKLLAKSQFVEIFGNPAANSHDLPVKKMGDILTGIDSGKSFVCENTPRTGNHPAVLKLSAVSIDGYKPDENKSLPSADMFVEKAEVKPGDLLFTRKNTPELVGTCAYVKSTPPCLMMPDLVFRLNPTEEVSRQYLCALINHSLFRPKIQNLASGSAKSMSNISKERLSKLDVPVPPMALQNEYAAFVEQLDKSAFTVKQLIEQYDLLYRAKLQEYFG